MPKLQALFAGRRADFEREITNTPDAKAAHDACVRCLGDLRRDYLDQITDASERLRLNELISAAEGGIAMMVAVSNVDIKLRLGGQKATVRRIRMGFKQLLVYLPCAMCSVLAIWLYLEAQLPAAVMALASGLMSLLSLMRLRPKQAGSTIPDVIGEATVDAQALSRWMDALLGRMDQLLEQDKLEQSAQMPELGHPMLEAIQMLMEAKLTEDGAFALKALPQMMAALESEGIEVELYTKASGANFDMLPAPVGGETIRPALLRDGRLLVRGQATIKG